MSEEPIHQPHDKLFKAGWRIDPSQVPRSPEAKEWSVVRCLWSLRTVLQLSFAITDNTHRRHDA